MRGHQSFSIRVVVGYMAAAVLFLTGMANTVPAGQGPLPQAPGPPPGARDPFAAARERQQREAMLRSAEIRPGKTTDQRGITAAVEQVKQDFRRIQILRNEIVRNITSEGLLDYESFSEKAGEINKRAHRLKTYLTPHKSEDHEKGQKNRLEISGEQMKEALITLCKRIESFVENPVFKVTGVLDIEQSAKARRDLQDIIQLSGGIRKGAERLSKTSKQ